MEERGAMTSLVPHAEFLEHPRARDVLRHAMRLHALDVVTRKDVRQQRPPRFHSDATPPVFLRQPVAKLQALVFLRRPVRPRRADETLRLLEYDRIRVRHADQVIGGRIVAQERVAIVNRLMSVPERVPRYVRVRGDREKRLGVPRLERPQPQPRRLQDGRAPVRVDHVGEGSHGGGCLAKYAFSPARHSSFSRGVALAWATSSIGSAWCDRRCRMSFEFASASGPPATSDRTHVSASECNRSAETTALIRPQRTAASASMSSPVNSSHRAMRSPTCRSRCGMTMAATRPRRTSG